MAAMRVRAMIGAALVAFVALPALALVASADEDPPLQPAVAGPPLRPPLTVLRAVDRAPAAPATATIDRPTKELIVLVGGYASEDDPRLFDAFRARAAREGGYDVLRFGRDLGSYDTLGAVDANAVQLRDSVRSVSPNYGGVHIVTHSMGGNVADRAFALGLSASDGVTSYVAWAAPHDGAHAAQAAQAWLAVSGPAHADARAVATTYLRDPDSPAVRDMARLRAPAPPPGVVRLDLRLATDGLVSSADARDPGTPSRILLPASVAELEGHGGILESREAFDLTMATIKAKTVPPDQRGVALRAASDVMAKTVDDKAQVVLSGICFLCLVGGITVFVRRTLRSVLPLPPLTE